MSSVTDKSTPKQSDRCKPQADLLTALRNDNYGEFENILNNYSKRIDINYLYDGPDYKTLLEIACSCKKKSKFVRRLLESGAVVNALNNVHGKAPIHQVVLYSDFETLKLLVENPGIDINFPDKEGNTVLHYAVQLDDREMISLLLDSGAHIGVRNANGDLAVQFMNAPTLQYLLDRSISSRGQLLDADYQLIFDYGLLIAQHEKAEPPAVEETELLAAISRVRELRPLLEHPILASFLDLKWQNLTSALYWRVLLSYALFSITVTAYIMLAHVPQTFLLTFKERTLFEGPLSWEDEKQELAKNYAVWWWLALLCITFIMSREVLQLLFYSKYKYFNEWHNYLKVAWIGVTYVTLTYDSESEDWRNLFAALTIFLSYIELMLLISQHPVVAISVHQFKTMIASYLKLMTWSAAFVLAFVMSFYILFTERSEQSYSEYTFSNVSVYLVKLAFKTPDIWTGEFTFHYFWLGCYFVFVTVTLFGLLNAVSMTNAVTINTQWVRFVSQAKFIINMEKSAPDLISLAGALNGCYQSMVERRLKRRQAQAQYSAALCPTERTVCVFTNQKNRIVASNMRFRNEDVDETSYCCCAKKWTFSKASIEGAKKIVWKRSSHEKAGKDDVAQAIAKVHSRLTMLERALKKADEKQESFVEATVTRTSAEERTKFESLMAATEERLQKAVKEASDCAVAEIRNCLAGIAVPASKDD